MRWNRCLTYASITAAFLLLTPFVSSPARAVQVNPISVLVDGQPAASAVLTFGQRIPVVASAASGAPVDAAVSGGCMLEGTTLRVTFAGQPCVLAVTSPATDEFQAASAQYVLPTKRGVQRANIRSQGSRLAPGERVRLATRQVGTNQGLKVSWRVTAGRDRCAIVLIGAQRYLQAKSKRGSCTVVASAPGVPGQYQPLRSALRFQVR